MHPERRWRWMRSVYGRRNVRHLCRANLLDDFFRDTLCGKTLTTDMTKMSPAGRSCVCCLRARRALMEVS